MPRKKISNSLKSIGVIEVADKGNAKELLFDPAKMPANVRKSIAAIGSAELLNKANASSRLYNDPFNPSLYEGEGRIANASIHEKIKIAQQYFKSDPLVGKIIEIMKSFANDGFKNEHPDPEIKKWYDDWCQAVEIDLVLDWIFLELFKTGNVTVYRELVPYKNGMFKFGAPEYFTNAAAKKEWSRKQIPIAFTVIDPTTVYADESHNNPFKDKFFISEDQVTIEASKSDPNTFTVKNGVTESVKKILKQDTAPLSSKKYQRILRMRQPYESYGSILMERAFNAIYEKNKMRQIDLDTMNSSLNQIIKVTVGSDEFPATPRQLKAVAQAFQNVGKSQIIFWNHTLKVEAIKNETKLIDEARYARVDADIRNAFGISEILLGGGGSKTNFATSYLSLKAFLTNLIDARKTVLRWLDLQYKDIAESVGFSSYPKPTFNMLSLTDEIAEKQIVMQLVDRGIISYETAQSTLGFDPKIELERRRREIPLVSEGVLGFIGSPYHQAVEEGIVNTDEESDKNVKKEDGQTVDNSDKKTNQKNRNLNKAKDPSVALPMKGDEGRPKGPGKRMPDRKSAKAEQIIEEDEKIMESLSQKRLRENQE